MQTPNAPLPPALLAQMADALMWPLLVLRADGTLLHANRAARRLLSTQRMITLLPDRRLGLLPAGRQPELQAALAAARQGQTAVLTWPAAGGSLGAAGSLGPLGDPRATAPGGGELLLALSATEQPDGQVQAYARLHRLSPAETRVLQRLALGDSSSEAAEALGVSAATVRSQIISLRRRTGHASVIQLLRGLASMPPVSSNRPLGAQGE
jgi:DNA-binding CsgD family transcriptional regulator